MNYKRTKYACFYTYLSMSSVFSLPPLLFVNFHNMYGISYTLLGTLVLINFCTQLTIDLIFSFFAKHFNIKKTIKIMPLLTSFGLFVYAVTPFLFPNYVYAGLVAGTVIFSVSAGLCEVLLSPLVAALPSENPGRDMSKLHSLYAYGVLMVILLSTVYFKIFGITNWMYLTFFWALLPVFSFILFSVSPMPEINISGDTKAQKFKDKYVGLALFALCIFFGSATENTMSNWVSGYLENALHISKMLGDILGMAMFAVLLGLGRTMYAKFGKKISAVLMFSMIGASVCYVVAGVSSNAIICVTACALTGFCSSMLWPGTLIMMEQCLPNAGVVAYALMAAGGDFGGAVAPQMLGFAIDNISASTLAEKLSVTLSMTSEQIGMKAGMLLSAIFPLIGIVVIVFIRRYFSKKDSLKQK